MPLLNKVCIYCILFLSCSTLTAQVGKVLSPKKIKKDIKECVKFLGAHPDPYKHISEEAFASLVDEAIKSVKEPMDQLALYKLIAPLAATIKDGHTSVHLPRGTMKKVRKDNGVFPYKMYLSNDNQLYVLKSYSEDNVIPNGSLIKSINGVSTADFFSSIDKYISYEREPFRNVIIERSFELYLLLAFDTQKDITFEYEEGGALKNSMAKNIDFKNWKDIEKEGREERETLIKQGKPYKYSKVSDGIGMITIHSFSVGEYDKYDNFLRKTFKKIANDSVDYLIIDVRGNFGGYPKVSAGLFHYLTDKPFKTMALSKLVVTQPFKNYLNNTVGLAHYRGPIKRSGHSQNWDAVLRDKVGKVVIDEAIFNELKITKENEFRGKVLLLTDRRSFSASSSFAATFRCYELGTIIGEETGGTKIFHANSIYQPLSNSQQYIGVATVVDFTACFTEFPDEGIEPDIEVIPSLLERVNGFDSQLQYCKLLIRKSEAQKAKNQVAKPD